MTDVLHGASVLGGLAFDPAIRGILVVLLAVVLLPGSIYLLLLTNLGSRLGFLVALAGLFGWMTILCITWTLTPPAIGPRGHPPSWEVIDIVYGDPSLAAEEIVQDLPHQCFSSVSRDCEEFEGTGTLSAQLLSANPDFAAELGDDATVSEILSVDPTAVDDLSFGEWTMISSGDAGEALAAADETLKLEEVFVDSSEYLVLDAWEQGGKEDRDPDASTVDRIWFKIQDAAQVKHPPHYTAIQLAPVIRQEAVVGEAPPTPVADPDAPVVTVVMKRNLGNLRIPAASATVAFGLMFIVTIYALHQRDKLAMENRAEG